MKEQFVTYEIAKYLKDLGFDEPCLGIYNGMQEIYCDSKIEHFTSQEKAQYIFGNDKVNVILAPLWQQVIDWLREVYKIHILIQRVIGNRGTSIESESWTFEGTAWKSWPTYYKAREQSILRALELIANK